MTRTLAVTTLLFSALLLTPSIQAQDTGNKLLSSSLGLYVYPTKNQSAEQQGKDDYECFNWARNQTGHDPLNQKTPEQPQVAAKPKADGSRIRGALRGAAGGAVIGEIADDEAGKGAGVGAAVGAMRAGKEKRRKQREQQQSAVAEAEQIAQQQTDGFNRAFSACLQGRGYTVQ